MKQSKIGKIPSLFLLARMIKKCNYSAFHPCMHGLNL